MQLKLPLISAFLFGLALTTASLAATRTIPVGTDPQATASVWLESSLRRVYPNTPPGEPQLQLLAARNTRIAFQICARSEKVQVLYVEPKLVGADDLRPRLRLEGLVPVSRLTASLDEVEGLGSIPGMVPDPLLPNTKVNFGPFQSHAFWVTLNIPADAPVGTRDLIVRVAVRSNENGVPAGDPLMIYPGQNGAPVDSIRWEVFAESLQDYAILQSAGIRPDDPLLADIHGYKDFPKSEAWVRQTMEKILRQPAAPTTTSAPR